MILTTTEPQDCTSLEWKLIHIKLRETVLNCGGFEGFEVFSLMLPLKLFSYGTFHFVRSKCKNIC